MIYSPATHCKNESLYKDKLLSKFDIPNLYCYASERASECERKMKENFLDTTKNWRIYGSRMESGDDQNTSALTPNFALLLYVVIYESHFIECFFYFHWVIEVVCFLIRFGIASRLKIAKTFIARLCTFWYQRKYYWKMY